MKTLKDLQIDGKRVFIRCDFNVPKDEFGNITDDRRIRSALQTIRYCIDRDCKIILASHYERPEPGKYEEKFSLLPVAKRLHTLLKIKRDIFMAQDVVGEDAKAKAAAMEPGDVLLLENLRYEAGETKNDPTFAEQLADFADFYINDAFGVLEPPFPLLKELSPVCGVSLGFKYFWMQFFSYSSTLPRFLVKSFLIF